MAFSGVLPTLRRMAGVAVGLAALACAASGVQARQAAAQAAPQDPLKFNYDGDIILIWSIKPDRADGFELAWKTIKTAMMANEKADVKALAGTLDMQKVSMPADAPVRVFVFRLSPASKAMSYNHVTLLFETLKAPAADPSKPAGSPNPPGTFSYDEAQELFKKIDGAWTEAGVVPWQLIKVG